MIFPSQNTSHENSNSPLIQNYHFTPPNRQILLSYNRLKIYGCYRNWGIYEEIPSTPLQYLVSTNFEDKISLRKVECNTRNYSKGDWFVISSNDAKIPGLTRIYFEL